MLATAVYLRNQCPTKAIEGKTPYEAISGEKPKVGHLRVFECTVYSHFPKNERYKLDDKARKCIFLGYSTNRKEYRLHDPNCLKIVHSRDVKLNEFVSGVEKETANEMTRDSRVIIHCSSDDVEALEDDNSLKEETEEQERDNKESTVTEERTEPTVRRYNCEMSRPDYYGIWVNSVNTITEPLIVKEALSSSEKENWKGAMQAEFESLHSNKVWDLVLPLKDRKVINSKWVFKCKLGENGLVECYKARLFAQGYSQRPGLDYEETFSPVVHLSLFTQL